MTIEQLKTLQLSQEVTVTKTIKEFDLYKRDTLIYLEYHKERESYNFLSVNKKGLTSILHLPPSIHSACFSLVFTLGSFALLTDTRNRCSIRLII